MNIVAASQIAGTVSIFLLFCMQFFIILHENSFQRSGRVAMLWTTIYIFFLFALRAIQLIGIGTLDQLRIISGFAAIITTVSVALHLIIYRHKPIPEGVLPTMQEAKELLIEAKQIKADAVDALVAAKRTLEKK